MSVIETVKETIGLEERTPDYRCESCGAEFDSGSEPGSYWFQCPECGEDDATRID